MKLCVHGDKTFSSKGFTVATLVSLLSYGLPVMSTELDVTAFSETRYTSNARLSSYDTQEDVAQRLGLDFLFKEDRKRFNANARFSIEQEVYLNDTFSDETNISTGIGIFNFDIIEDFLDWRSSFTRKQILNDAALGDTPDNRIQRNIFRTGPTINYRINPTNTVLVDVNFIQVEISDDESADTKRVAGNASYKFQYNSLTSLSLSSSYDKIIESDYGDPSILRPDEKVERVGLNVGIDRVLFNGLMGARLGQNRIESSVSETITGNHFDIYFLKDQLFWHELNLNYSESISDSSLGFEDQPDEDSEPDSESEESTAGLDIVKRKRFEVSLARQLDLVKYQLTGALVDRDYEIQLNDEKEWLLALELSHRVSRSFSVAFNYEHNRSEFLDNPDQGENLTNSYSFDGRFDWTKQLSIEGTVAYDRRKNNKNSLREYEQFSCEFTVLVSLF